MIGERNSKPSYKISSLLTPHFCLLIYLENRNTMDHYFLDQKIDDFWNWFIQTEAQFRAFFEDETVVNQELLVEEMNNKVLDFGMFSWEIGPGQEKKYALTISPNGSKQRLSISKQMMYAAPLMPEWELHYCKPAKDWDFTFQLFDDFMIQRKIDASSWQFLLAKSPGEGISILLDSPSIQGLSEDLKQNAADLVITNCIGEEHKIDYLKGIQFINEFDAPNNKGKAIKTLKNDFDAMVQLL